MQKLVTDEEIKSYNRKKRCEISLKSIGKKPEVEEQTHEQKEWVHRRMKGDARSWETWDHK